MYSNVVIFFLFAAVHAGKVTFFDNGEKQLPEVASTRHFKSPDGPECYISQVEYDNSNTQHLIEYLCCELSALNCVESHENELQPRSILRSRPRQPLVENELTKKQLRLRTEYGTQISAANTDNIPSDELVQVCEEYIKLCKEYVSTLPCVGKVTAKAIVLIENWEY